jgi:hypothetical protein
MREILYRGISKDKEVFIFGSLLHNSTNGKMYIVPIHGFDPVTVFLTDFEVYPETVGEYTGIDIRSDSKSLIPINRRVFEGDVLMDDNGINWVVEFRKGCFGALCMKTNEFCSLSAVTTIYDHAKCIGTIHDHYFAMPYEDKKLLNEELVILEETVAQIEKVISKRTNFDKLAESLRKLNDEIKRVSKEVQK